MQIRQVPPNGVIIGLPKLGGHKSLRIVECALAHIRGRHSPHRSQNDEYEATGVCAGGIRHTAPKDDCGAGGIRRTAAKDDYGAGGIRHTAAKDENGLSQNGYG